MKGPGNLWSNWIKIQKEKFLLVNIKHKICLEGELKNIWPLLTKIFEFKKIYQVAHGFAWSSTIYHLMQSISLILQSS